MSYAEDRFQENLFKCLNNIAERLSDISTMLEESNTQKANIAAELKKIRKEMK